MSDEPITATKIEEDRLEWIEAHKYPPFQKFLQELIKAAKKHAT